jgi:hypothetical protein
MPMSSERMKRHRAFTYFDNAEGRELVKAAFTDHLIGLECIDDGPDAFRRYQEAQALALLRKHRKLKARRGETGLELISLWRREEDGPKTQYFKACGHLNLDEAAQHIDYWDHKVAEDDSQRKHYREFHLKRLGEPLQRLLFGEEAA